MSTNPEKSPKQPSNPAIPDQELLAILLKDVQIPEILRNSLAHIITKIKDLANPTTLREIAKYFNSLADDQEEKLKNQEKLEIESKIREIGITDLGSLLQKIQKKDLQFIDLLTKNRKEVLEIILNILNKDQHSVKFCSSFKGEEYYISINNGNAQIFIDRIPKTRQELNLQESLFEQILKQDPQNLVFKR